MKFRVKQFLVLYKLTIALIIFIFSFCSYFKENILMTIEPNEYNLNPGEKICGQTNNGHELAFVSFTPISIDLFHHRQTLREVWSHQSFNSIRSIFIVGKSVNDTLNEQVKRESQIYGDILQGNFEDTYRNLVKKTLLGIKWMSEYCSQAKFILKIDDDMVMNTQMVISYFQRLVSTREEARNKIYGNCNHKYMWPVRDSRKKQFISKEDYAPDKWDKYCHGPAYALTSDILKPLYNLSKYVRQFPMEDCYLGTLAKHLKIDLVHVDGWVTKISRFVSKNNFYFLKKKFYFLLVDAQRNVYKQVFLSIVNS